MIESGHFPETFEIHLSIFGGTCNLRRTCTKLFWFTLSKLFPNLIERPKDSSVLFLLKPITFVLGKQLVL